MTDTSSLKHPRLPHYSNESHLKKQGFHFIAGVDEAGRGPLAGPVVAAAVILDHHNLPIGVNDSKRLSAKQRQEIFSEILHHALSIGVASLCAAAIDGGNIRQMTLEAMRRAIQALAILPDHALIDGRDIPTHLPCPADSLIRGDQISLSIASASIIAKVTRDHMMKQAAIDFPAYGFDKHAGYGTKYHCLALQQHGAVPRLHRFTFAPIKHTIHTR